MVEKRRFFYYHSPFEKGEKRFTIAGVLDENTISISAAVCSPKDQFIRKTGRALALGRALVLPFSKTTVEKDAIKGLAFRQLADQLIEELVEGTVLLFNGRIKEIIKHAEKSVETSK